MVETVHAPAVVGKNIKNVAYNSEVFVSIEIPEEEIKRFEKLTEFTYIGP